LGVGAVWTLAAKVWLHYHPGWTEPTYFTPLGAALGTVVAFGYTLHSTLGRHGESWSQLGTWNLPPRNHVLSAFVAGSGLITVNSELGNALQIVWPTPAFFHAWFDHLHRSALFAPIALVIAAPVLEELLFRGVILRRLLVSGTRLRAVVLSSLLFGAIHLNPWQFLGAFSGGLLLGWIYVRTRSLWLCIAGHALNNACSLYASALPVKISGFNHATADGPIRLQPLWFDLLGVVLLVAGSVWFARLTPPATVIESPNRSLPPSA
jgi:membrane protease YdiL (CAAX protease family)